MSWVTAAAIVGGTTLIGGYLGSQAANKAAGQESNAAMYGVDAQQNMFNTINQQQQPYRQAGYNALNQLGDLTSPGGYLSHQFNASDLNSNLAPNYQFQLDQGMGALRNQMSSMGGNISGNTLKAINDYSQNYAGGAYQQAFENYQNQQNNIYNRLTGIANLGSGSLAQTTQAGTYTGQGIANSMNTMGQAQAAGTMGAANAYTGALNNMSNLATWYALSKK